MKLNRYLALAVASAIGVGHAAPALSSERAEPAATTGSALLEEVTVVARRRASGEAAIDAPLAVSAFSGAQFEAVFAQNLDDIGRLAPSAQFKGSPQVGVQNFTIRGMGVSGTTPSDEPAVAIFQDGVYWGSNYGALIDTFDVESIEVLRGPQGTLFGRNVTGGAILVRSARPTGDLGAKVETVVGNAGRLDFSGEVEGPLAGDKLVGKLAVMTRSHDGYFQNVFTGEDVGEDQSTLVRGMLVAHPTDDLDVTLILERYKQDGSSLIVKGIEVPGTGPYIDGYRAPPEPWDVALNNPGRSHIKVDLGVLTAEWTVGGGVLTSISGVRDVHVDNRTDFDGTQFTHFDQTINYDQRQFSQELLFASSFGEHIDFTTGLYYFDQDVEPMEGRELNRGLTETVTAAKLTQRSYAAYGEADYNFSDRWTFTLGARYTHEEKTAETAPFASATTTCADGAVYGFEDCQFAYGRKGEESWSDVSPRAVLAFHPTEDQTLYGSVTRGFRSGGFSVRGNPLFSPFDSENVTAFEIGYKAELLQRRLRLEPAVYVNKYKDLQRTILGTDPVFGTVQSTFNVADATIQGAELTLTAEVADGLVLSLNYAYTDAQYDSAVAGFNISNTFVRVPESAGTFSANYDRRVASGGLISLRAAATYTDSMWFNDANTVWEPSYTLVDASAGYETADGRWNIALYGKNLNDRDYSFYSATLGTFGSIRALGPPRTYGVRLTYDF